MNVKRSVRVWPAEKWAEWWVQLTCWKWPDDMPGKPLDPLERSDPESLVRGAFAVVDLIADPELVDRIWKDRPRREALLREAT